MSRSRPVAPARLQPVRIGVVGLNFGAYIVKHLIRPPAQRWLELVAVADLNRPLADRIAAETGVRSATWAELLADPEVEAIGLFTGPDGRAKLIREAVRAGKHVLTTKPFEVSVASAASVLEEAAGVGRVVHLNSPSPTLSAELAQIQQWQQAHDLGRIVALRAEAWGSYHEAADGSWYDDPVRCPVAPIFRLGIYLIHDIIALAGRPSAIQVAHTRIRTGRPTPDNAVVNLVFPGGALATIYASFCVDDGQPYKNSLTANFERGTIYRNCGAPARLGAIVRSELALVRRGRVHAPRVRRRSFKELSGDYQWREFALAVRSQCLLPATTHETLLAGLQVVDALADAARTGRLTPLR